MLLSAKYQYEISEEGVTETSLVHDAFSKCFPDHSLIVADLSDRHLRGLMDERLYVRECVFSRTHTCTQSHVNALCVYACVFDSADPERAMVSSGL